MTGAAAAIWLSEPRSRYWTSEQRPCCPAWMPTARCWASPSHRGCKPRSTVCAVRRLSPHVELRAPESVLGRNTADSVRAGVVYGTAAMADGLVERTLREAHLPLIHRWSPPAGCRTDSSLLPPPDAPGGRTDVIRAVPRLCAYCPARGTAERRAFRHFAVFDSDDSFR